MIDEATRAPAGRAETPQARRSHGLAPALPAHRAFVVHFGRPSASGRHRFRGRVEHLSSGRAARFASLRGLLDFVRARLAEPQAPPE